MATVQTNYHQEVLIISRKYKLKAVTICFLAAFITGGFGAAIGLVSPQLAAFYGVHVSHIVYLDVLNIVGLLIGNILSARLMERLGCHKTLLLAIFLGIIAQFTISFGFPLAVYAVCALINGACLGLLVPTVSQSIFAAYRASNKGEARLNILNFFFGLGAAVVPIVGGYIVHYFSWKGVFAALGSLYVLLFILAFFCVYRFEQADATVSHTKEASSPSENHQHKMLNLSIVLIALALVFYVYVEYIVSYWFSPYLQEEKSVAVIYTGAIIGVFWAMIALFRLIVGIFILTKIKPAYYLIISTAITIVGFVVFLASDSIILFFIGAIILGIGCSALFPTLLGYGITQANYNSPKITAFLIMSGSIGAAICLFTSGFLGQHINKQVPIYLGPLLGIGIIILVSIVIWKEKQASNA